MKAGDKMKHKYIPNLSIELLSTTNRGWKVRMTEIKRGREKSKIAYFNNQDLQGERSLFNQLQSDLKS